MSAEADVLVVGLGIHGSAAAYELARGGAAVVGIDQFPEGHRRGSSHGTTRMIRRAYPNPAWNDLVARAYAGWERWERASGQALVHRTGGLYTTATASTLEGPGCAPVDDPDRLRRLMPAFAVPEGYRAVYDPSAGVVAAGRALAVARAGARAAGAELAFGEAMLDWSATGTGCLVETSKRRLRVRSLVLATGAWAGRAVPRLAPLFEVWRIVTVTLRPGQEVARPPRLGAFSVDRPEGLVFGIPDAAGDGFKAGIDAGEVWDPDRPPAPPTRAEVAELCRLMSGYVPGARTDPERDVVEAAACLYTMTADRRFVLGRLPWAPRVVVAAACSGHGFKFGPAVGEAVADLCRGEERRDLDFIGVDRRLAGHDRVPQRGEP
ncbi:FAD-dependent oxidoreductase [Phytohabitans sp. ZYX-F-186]|uniref:FAD-dependent oxidoreductase n=1 Tax=Phytohabitans maris TaxID=3071409 RepID=A0ABU0Z9F2_9ACTN|nr:FAD-dependent oxidoreductase [Phytohabitans sp. ZYX-F-186]MDQ7903659.1 FAD-dependent oxidoreductase [Phytohabitans sp. ZYX-F-186]